MNIFLDVNALDDRSNHVNAHAGAWGGTTARRDNLIWCKLTRSPSCRSISGSDIPHPLPDRSSTCSHAPHRVNSTLHPQAGSKWRASTGRY